MTDSRRPRRPEAFQPDDPTIEVGNAEPVISESKPEAGRNASVGRSGRSGAGDAGGADATNASSPGGGTARGGRGIRWGAILLAAAGALASLALALSFARFVSIAFERQDWLGWLAFGLLAIGGLAAIMLLGRELVGFLRLRRLGRVRADAERVLRQPDRALERRIVARVTAPFSARPELQWQLQRLAEHARDVRDPGDLLRLTDRDVLLPIDGEARRIVARAARRIGTVSAISPAALLTVGWVLIENLRLLRQLAALYGGRPGFMGTARLARMVFVHIVATGGVALTDDLIGQFLGQDILRRLSRRLGESVFNAALTARIGAAAIEVIRPLPFIEAPRVRARDFIAEITRRSVEKPAVEEKRPS